MKRKAALLLPLLLLGQLTLAQTLRVRDFAQSTDSLQQRMQRRTGVYNRYRLEKVTARQNGTVDFYYSGNLSGYPWRPGDDRYFKAQLAELAADLLNGKKVGSVYVNSQELSALPMPEIKADGKPVGTSLRVNDPRSATVPLVRNGEWWPSGLSGRHLALWQSHGRYWEADTERWEWQRSANHTTIEDVYTQSYVLPFLIPMLENAGAVVLTPRERDTQVHEVVCDNDPAFPGPREGLLRQEGSFQEKGAWADAGCGFADARERYSGYENPFTMGTARQTRTTRGDETPATVLWRPDIPEKGRYAVYVSYKTLPSSTTDARYTVHHCGGETLLHVNQQMGGGTWIYLGTFLFDQGKEGYVELSSRSETGGTVTADAVRFGGGMGKVEREGTLSNLPAYAEGALYSMQYGGMDLSLFDRWENDYTKDYAGRGLWVQDLSGGSRVNPAGKGKRIPIDLSLAFHSDAGNTPNDSIVGTLAIYTLKSNRSAELPNGESRMNGRLLGDFVQTQVVGDLRQSFEPAWTRRHLWDRSYSESRTTGVPGLLLELLSHMNFADMRYGLDPGFRFTASRAVYKGMLKYLSARYGCPYVVQPLPVHAFRAQLDTADHVLLSWEATPDPLEPTAGVRWYKVYTRRDDGDFGPGLQTEGNSCRLSIEPGHLYSFKITACNPGGESFPSEVLSVGTPVHPGKKVLIVNNFTRISGPTWFDTPTHAGFTDTDAGVPWGTDLLYAGSVNQFDRSVPWMDDDNPGFGGSYWDKAGSRIAGNSFDFPALYGKALLADGYAFDSSSEEAFDGNSDAFAAIIICGKQVTTRIGRGAVPDRYSVFPKQLQDALTRYTSRGGDILISGAYIGTDAWSSIYQGVEKAPESTRNFVTGILGYKWVTNFGDMSGTAEPTFPAGLGIIHYNRDFSEQCYRVENPDGIAPASARTKTLMRYHGTNIPAATWYEAGGYQVAAFGFPLETSPQLPAVLQTLLTRFDSH